MATTYQEKIRINAALILLLALALPVIPAIFAYEGKALRWEGHFAVDFAVLAGLALGIVTLFSLHWKHKRQWKDFVHEILSIFWQGKFACFLGISAGIVAAYIYLILPFDKGIDLFAERAASAFAIYIGVFGSVLGIHTLHRKSAPITEVELLLESVADDLEEFGKSGNKLLIIYPALNIGYYRALLQYHYNPEGNKGNIPDDHPYERFSLRLAEAARKTKSKARIVTYETDLYRPLYEAYDRSKDKPDPQRVDLCVSEALDLAHMFAAAAGGPKSHIQVHPNQCLPSVIVIGPVSYCILSYGLPRYREDEKGFFSNDKAVASLLVYRREDSALAGLIYDEVDSELRRMGKI